MLATWIRTFCRQLKVITDFFQHVHAPGGDWLQTVTRVVTTELGWVNVIVEVSEESWGWAG